MVKIDIFFIKRPKFHIHSYFNISTDKVRDTHKNKLLTKLLIKFSQGQRSIIERQKGLD